MYIDYVAGRGEAAVKWEIEQLEGGELYFSFRTFAVSDCEMLFVSCVEEVVIIDSVQVYFTLINQFVLAQTHNFSCPEQDDSVFNVGYVEVLCELISLVF